MGFMEYGSAYGTPTRRPSIDFEGIRNDNPVSSIAGSTIKLIRAGKEWKACCPFHPDRSPSFTIFDDDRRFQCFGCGASGDVIDFVEMLHKVGTREAVAMLGANTLPTVEIRPMPSRVEPERDTTAEALALWEGASPIIGTVAETYLRRRGIGVLITDHNVRETLDIVDRAYILHDGSVLMDGRPSEIVAHQDVRRVYLGDRFSL